MIDGTRDESGKGQAALCLGYVDHDFFFFFYQESVVLGFLLALKTTNELQTQCLLPVTIFPCSTRGYYKEVHT